MLRPNDTIGPYVIKRRLGQGGFGEVWLAEKRTPLIVKEVAVKLPLTDEPDLEKIRREAEVWKQAGGHPNVLPIIEADIYDGQIVIVSEYAMEGSLAEWLKRHGGGAPTVEDAVRLERGILSGLVYLHGLPNPIVHRDLKPSNILLRGGEPCIVDFGLARVLKTSNRSTTISGTLPYMSPEALRGDRSVGTDLWSAGVILHLMLAGKLPFEHEDMFHLMDAIRNEAPTPIPTEVPESLRRMAERALFKDAVARYPSAREMLAALEDSWHEIRTPWRSASRQRQMEATVQTPPSPRDQMQSTVAEVPDSKYTPTEVYPQPGPTVQSQPPATATARSALPPETVQEVPKAPSSSIGQASRPEPAQSARPAVAHPQALPKKGFPMGATIAIISAGVIFVMVVVVIILAYVIPGKSTPVSPPLPGNIVTNSLGMQFVPISAGTFIMGSDTGDKNERPPHRVSIAKPFYIQTTEVTQKQWTAVMDKNPSDWVGDDLPVHNVSWDDAQQFIQRLNNRGEGKYRLPTETEWEYACRAGSNEERYGELDSIAWHSGNANDQPHAVKQKQPNAWGLYDTLGNLWEWCADKYQGDYTQDQSPKTDQDSSEAVSRVQRGGSWAYSPFYCRTTSRIGYMPTFKVADTGLRLVRE